MLHVPALTEERVRFVCRGLGLDPERLCRDDAANLCVTLGVQQVSSVLIAISATI